MSPLARIGTVAVVCLGLIMMAMVLLPSPLFSLSLATSSVTLPVLLFAGLLSLGATLASDRSAAEKALLPWSGRERVAWLCIAGGLLLGTVGLGWRWISAVPSAGIGLLATVPSAPASTLQLLLQLSPLAFPLLLWLSFFLWPAASAGRERLLLILDSFLVLLTSLGLAWNLGIFSSLRWPLSSGALLWETLLRPLVDLLLIGTALLLWLRLGTASTFTSYRLPPRRASLLCLVAGLLIYALADLLAGHALAWSWLWPGAPAWRDRVLAVILNTGLLLCGLAAYLRRVVRCPPGEAGGATPAPRDEPLRQQLSRCLVQHDRRVTAFPFVIYLPHILLITCFAILTWNVWQSGQRQLFIGCLVLGLAICLACWRLLLTQAENRHLARLLFGSCQEEIQHLEAQVYTCSRRSNALEAQLARLREVLAQLAAGNLAARLEPAEDDLKPLAISLNQLADREMRLELWNQHNQLLRIALEDLCAALERCPSGEPLVIPPSCEGIPQIERLLTVTGLRQFAEQSPPSQSSLPVSSSNALPPLFPPTLPVTGEPEGGLSPEHVSHERPSW
ncbi:hypothetical protein [Thermogemmatispora sp.]|uniref:HAMP domain-containing protein n=1 Tax=Thermogemmatispora sp. TaxID=1968838 RepID=UPI001DDA5B76|nr:hypothetical protein [Thermogemmatispora sp.]MBX5449918.1 hypothetical protein [Thermogemmatispora sp.]